LKVKSFVTIVVILTMVWSPFILGTSWAQSTDDSQHLEMPEEQSARIDLDLRGDIMLVSATIMGFGVFGGLLAARFRGNDIKMQVACTLIIYVVIFCKMALHLYVIMIASQGILTQSTYEYTIDLMRKRS